ncbi:MAG: P-II family nitrogen regulator [bacterium]
MAELNLITCIVQRGKADKLIKAAMDAGAQGATSFYARGTGVRQKLGVLGLFIQPEKEVIMIAARPEETDAIFNALVSTGKLDRPGLGFAFVSKIDKAIGLMEKK